MQNHELLPRQDGLFMEWEQKSTIIQKDFILGIKCKSFENGLREYFLNIYMF